MANQSGGEMNMMSEENIGKRVFQKTGIIIICTVLLSYALLGIGFFGCLMIVTATGIFF